MSLSVRLSILENVAHFFHPIGYTLTCLVSGVGAIMLTVVLSGEVSWRRRYIGCFGKEWSGASWVIDYRTGSSRWVWGTAKSLEF